MSSEQPSVPVGFCQCGCGERTKPAVSTDPRVGAVKGKPQRFLAHHHNRRSPVEYIEEDRGHETACWVWQRGRNNKGYGQVRINGKGVLAHRWYYERYVAPIPAGLVMDHLCRVPLCVNPAHLEPVTMRENLLRGKGFVAVQAARTHCPRGHEYTPENTWVCKQGSRHCRQCWACRCRRKEAKTR